MFGEFIYLASGVSDFLIIVKIRALLTLIIESFFYFWWVLVKRHPVHILEKGRPDARRCLPGAKTVRQVRLNQQWHNAAWSKASQGKESPKTCHSKLWRWTRTMQEKKTAASEREAIHWGMSSVSIESELGSEQAQVRNAKKKSWQWRDSCYEVVAKGQFWHQKS